MTPALHAMHTEPMMNAPAANFALHALSNLDLAPVRAVNIAPIVSDFGGMDNRKLLALAAICRKIAEAHYAGPGYAQMVKPADFAVLKAFVAFAEADIALAGIVKRDDAVDQPHSADESHFLDREKL